MAISEANDPLVLQRDFTFPIEPSVAYDVTSMQPRGDVDNN
jgi:hypothetical protein